MSEELKPCPFCGKSDKSAIYTESMVHHGELLWIRYGVKCKRCHFGTSTYAKKATAIRKWNTRPAEDALTAEVERLKAEIERIKMLIIFRRDWVLKTMIEHNATQFIAELNTLNTLLEAINNPDTGKGGEDEP